MLIVFSFFCASIFYRVGARKLAAMLDSENAPEASKTAAKNMRKFSNGTQISFVLVWLSFVFYGSATADPEKAKYQMFYLQMAFGSMVASLYLNLLYVQAGVKKKLKNTRSSSKVGVSTNVSSNSSRRGSTQVSQVSPKSASSTAVSSVSQAE
jgi:hypothetical protein